MERASLRPGRRRRHLPRSAGRQALPQLAALSSRRELAPEKGGLVPTGRALCAAWRTVTSYATGHPNNSGAGSREKRAAGAAGSWRLRGDAGARRMVARELHALAGEVELDDVRAEEERQRPVHDDAHAPAEAGHLEEVVGA